MTAQVSNSPISSLIRTIRERVVGSEQPSSTRSADAQSYIDAIDLVRDFVDRFAVSPEPGNYELIYRHSVLKEPGLHAAIDELISNGTAANSSTNPTMSEAELDDLAQKALEQLHGVEGIVAKSSKEAQGFGRELEGGAAKLTDVGNGNEAVLSLINITRTMITKTKAAEAELAERGKVMRELQHSLAEARVRADTDVLTGLSNRRAFERELGASSERCTINKLPLALAICDVDHFKSINDQFGHVTGDRVLKLISNILETHCAGKGKVSRFGGEEFVILFENMEGDAALEILDAARRDLVARKIVKKETGEPLGAISFSGGICTLAIAGDPGELLKVADRRLYAAKANGRNCIIGTER
jgi:diguanylate cyclase